MPRGPAKTEVMHIRMTANDAAMVRAGAADVGLSPSEFARRAMMSQLGRASFVDPADVAWAREVAEGLRKAGVNVNQVTRAVNGGRLADASDTKPAMAELATVVTRLGRAYSFLGLGVWSIDPAKAGDGSPP